MTTPLCYAVGLASCSSCRGQWWHIRETERGATHPPFPCCHCSEPRGSFAGAPTLAPTRLEALTIAMGLHDVGGGDIFVESGHALEDVIRARKAGD